MLTGKCNWVYDLGGQKKRQLERFNNLQSCLLVQVQHVDHSSSLLLLLHASVSMQIKKVILA
jgi:hypothetical protein